MSSFPKRPGLGALLARRPSTSAGTTKDTTTCRHARPGGESSSAHTLSAPLLSTTQASGFLSTLHETMASPPWSPRVTFARKASESGITSSSDGDHLLMGLKNKGATMLHGVRYAFNTALVQLASVESPSGDASLTQVASKAGIGSSTMLRRQSGVPVASSRIGESSSAFPWTPLSPPVISPCNWRSKSPTCSGSSPEEQSSASSSPLSSTRPLLSPDTRFASQNALKNHRPATAGAALSSPSSASALSPRAPTSLPASPLSSASSRDMSASGLSGQSSDFFETNNNGRSTSRQQEAHQQCGPGQDFWVDEDGQMVFRILPLHAPHVPSDADVFVEHQQKHGGHAQAEEVDR